MIINLRDAADLDRAVIGTKAANLALLAADGFAVPDGFVIPADERIGELARVTGTFAVRSSAVSEDLAEASYAGLYETYLNVPADELIDAVRRCRASAAAERVAAYGASSGVAVLVQRMVDAEAAGVAFTANPVTGARDEVVITAVRGLGEALVSGRVVGAEWIVRGGQASGHEVLTPEHAMAVAELALRVREQFGDEQDIEWAIEDGQLYLLQARPMTALPEPVAWQPPGPGLWVRNFRIGEWLPDPVTPLFAEWLLELLDQGFREGIRETTGSEAHFPYAIVNGWYYTRPIPSLKHLPNLTFMVNALIRTGRDPAGADRALLGDMYQRWHDELLPAYRAASGVDEIGRMAGRHLWYLAVVGGAAWKMEACLARFMRRHHLGDPAPLLRGLPHTDLSLAPHAVYSLDWYHPTATTQPAPPPRQNLVDERLAAERACLDRLKPGLRPRFTAMLRTAQRYAVIREEQAGLLTLGWPRLRAAILAIGRRLTDDDLLETPADVFFLTQEELSTGGPAGKRRRVWERQRRLVAPLSLGSPPPLIGRHLARTLGVARRTGSELYGQPASAGRATGPARIVLDPGDFAKVKPGDVLVARTTAPAWTPLFSRVVAVITDGGSAAAHASLIAREYGIPAVVATGDATVRLRDGQPVAVDGSQGVVQTGLASGTEVQA
ncbi:PEP/pyruvate-binding domain-containing protein [Nonomuraea sediminis]|uniref:PEP/pyruvate-binding domain-containing protein n=1 Tax=Nonomuraea sediminis TaxID=2835864 RepID=UPI001BDCAC1C|nr:PEP/pyruvate-binding domain-containing protein [Nonomuraea sediminis]